MSKIALCGAAGRMGQSILKILVERGHSVGAAFEAKGSKVIGLSAGAFIQRGDMDLKISPISDSGIIVADGIIDFSSPEATMEILPYALKHRKPLVIGTTGFTEDDRKKIEAASADIPVIISPNMSVGVNLLFKLTEMASKTMKNGYDVEVFEAHHRFKKDSPSGTASRLIDIIKKSIPRMNRAPEKIDRKGQRTDDEIGVMVMRGGDIVGEHTVYFVGLGERIELTHRASSRDTFALGAVLAVEFLTGKKPGLYSMFDVLGI
jgi:4-hydroxy-tetrahydrodipicolinate reductase